MRGLKFGIIAISLGFIGIAGTSLATANNNNQSYPESVIYSSIYNCTQYQQLTQEKKANIDKALDNLKL